MPPNDAGQPHLLRPFQARHAGSIAKWVTDEAQLHLLAPSSELPLTPAKVIAWKKKTGEAFVLQGDEREEPVGYGEINPMRLEPTHYWLGHIIVRPDRRGEGLGQLLVKKMTHYAFSARSASRLSLIVFPENASAIRCYKEAGYQEKTVEFQRFGGRGPIWKLLRFQIDRCAVSPAASG